MARGRPDESFVAGLRVADRIAQRIIQRTWSGWSDDQRKVARLRADLKAAKAEIARLRARRPCGSSGSSAKS